MDSRNLLIKNRILLYGGAIRGAKTHFGCMMIISLCQIYPNSRWVMLRKDTATKAGKNVGEWLNKIGYTQRIMQYGDKSTKNRNNIDDNKKSFYELFTEAISKEGFRIEDKMLKAAPPIAGIADFLNAIFAGEIPGLSIEIGENCK